MPTFGKTNIGTAAQGYAFFSDAITGCAAVLSETGRVSKITIYCRVSSGTANFQAAIYDSDNNLKGHSNSVSVGSTAGWVDFPLVSPVTLAAGTYRLVTNGETIGKDLLTYLDGGGMAYYEPYVEFDDGWPDPSEMTAQGAATFSAYATYEIPYRQRVILI